MQLRIESQGNILLIGCLVRDFSFDMVWKLCYVELRNIMDMKKLIGVGMMALAVVMVVPSVYGEEEDKDNRRAMRSAVRGGVSVERIYNEEMTALAEAEQMMKGVTDEKSARDIAKKLIKKFDVLFVPMGGAEAQLEALARAQNRVTMQMLKHKKQPWFVSSGLQEAWSLITVPSFRRRATNHGK